MSQQKWNHSVTGAKKLVHLYVSFCVNRPSARITCHQGLQPELKLRQKGLQICRRCFKCCHFTKRGRFNASQGESWVRGGKLSKGLGCAKTWCIEAELYWTSYTFLPHITLCVLLNFYSYIHACLWFKSEVSQSARGPIRGLGSIIWAAHSFLHSLWLFSHMVFISDLI